MNVLQKLIRSIAISLVVFIVCNFSIISPVFAKNIAAAFGAGVTIATPNGNIAVENLKQGDRVIGYNFEISPREYILTGESETQQYSEYWDIAIIPDNKCLIKEINDTLTTKIMEGDLRAKLEAYGDFLAGG